MHTKYAINRHESRGSASIVLHHTVYIPHPYAKILSRIAHHLDWLSIPSKKIGNKSSLGLLAEASRFTFDLAVWSLRQPKNVSCCQLSMLNQSKRAMTERSFWGRAHRIKGQVQERATEHNPT